MSLAMLRLNNCSARWCKTAISIEGAAGPMEINNFRAQDCGTVIEHINAPISHLEPKTALNHNIKQDSCQAGWSKSYEKNFSRIDWAAREETVAIKIGEISATNVDTFYRGPSDSNISIEKMVLNQTRIVFDIQDDRLNYFEFSRAQPAFKIPIPKDWTADEVIKLSEIFTKAHETKTDPKSNLEKSPLWERWLSVGANAGTIIDFLGKITGAV